MLPKISVIVPVYNAEQYIEKCLDSILASDIDSLEIITINDGSTDNSLKILKEYERLYGIIVLDQPNSGASAARNKGLEVAQGEFIGFVDSDDWIEPDMYSVMYEKATRFCADIVCCNLYRNQNERMRKYLESKVYGKQDILDYIYPILISNLNERDGSVTLRGAVWMRIFRRAIIVDNQIQFNTGLIYNEDGLFCIQATLVSNCYYYMGDDYLYHQRYVADSLTKRYVPSLWNQQKKMVQLLQELTCTCSYDFTNQIRKKIMEIAIYCIENECKENNTLNSTERIPKIKEILYDKELASAVRQVSFFNLKKINKGYWIALYLRSVRFAQIIARHRANKHNQ